MSRGDPNPGRRVGAARSRPFTSAPPCDGPCVLTVATSARRSLYRRRKRENASRGKTLVGMTRTMLPASSSSPPRRKFCAARPPIGRPLEAPFRGAFSLHGPETITVLVVKPQRRRTGVLFQPNVADGRSTMGRPNSAAVLGHRDRPTRSGGLHRVGTCGLLLPGAERALPPAPWPGQGPD